VEIAGVVVLEVRIQPESKIALLGFLRHDLLLEFIQLVLDAVFEVTVVQPRSPRQDRKQQNEAQTKSGHRHNISFQEISKGVTGGIPSFHFIPTPV
tara:strand:- start:143 stop:430 length:288 start_codon:yes stop_codon:yes gene_type:complete